MTSSASASVAGVSRSTMASLDVDLAPLRVEYGARPSRPLTAGRLTVSEAPGTVSGKRCAVNIVTGGLGTGVLVLPWCSTATSLLGALVLIPLILLGSYWVSSIVVEAGDKAKVYDLGTLLGKIPGTTGYAAKICCNVMMCVSAFMILVSYFVVMTDGSCAVAKCGARRWPWRFAGVGWVTPLCFFEQRALIYTSTLILLGAFYSLCFAGAALMFQKDAPKYCYLGGSSDSIFFIGAVVNTIAVQLCILPMYAELRERSVDKMCNITKASFTVLGVLLTLYAICGYMLFGEHVQTNVIRSLPPVADVLHGVSMFSEAMFVVTEHIGTIVAAVGAYPILLNPLMVQIKGSGIVIRGVQLHTLSGPFTIFIILATAAASSMFDKLAYWCIANGFMCLGFFGAFFPALIGTYILGKPRWQMIALLVGGVTVSILGGVKLSMLRSGAPWQDGKQNWQLDTSCLLTHEAQLWQDKG